MKIKLFFLFALLFTSANALANKYCKVTKGTDDISVSLGEVYIPPGIEIGSIIKKSEIIKTTITCSDTRWEAIVAYANTSKLEGTGITVKLRTPNYYGENCEVTKTGYPGLGIAWMNYNYRANKWVCAFDKRGMVTRGMSPGSAEIYDQIYLVKTGPISDGNFVYNNPFLFEERVDNPPNYPKTYGDLYKITLEGSAKIIAPVCTATSASDTYKFTIDKAIKLEYQSPDYETINITCTGNIENGTNALFNPVSNDGEFTQNHDYFATSDESVGVEVSYKVNNDTTEKVVKPLEQISVPINDSKGQIFLKYKPYIVKDSGKYPLTDKINFNLSLKSE